MPDPIILPGVGIIPVISGGGGSSVPFSGGVLNYSDQELIPANCTTDGADTGLSISQDPIGDSGIIIMVNGARSSLADGPLEQATSAFYFTDTPGGPAKLIKDVVAGDMLYYNALVSGFPINGGMPDFDRISLYYDVAPGS